MQYFVLQAKVGGSIIELPFILPQSVNASDVVDALLAIPELEDYAVVAGGQVNADMIRPSCSGNIPALGVSNRSGQDTSLFISYDDTHGEFLDV